MPPARFARRHGLPLVATYHTFFEDYLHHYVPVLPRGIGRFLARAFTRSQCRDVAALVAPSAPMRDALLAYGVETPIEVLPTGLPAASFRRGDGARFRERFGIEANRAMLLLRGARGVREEHRFPAAHVRAPARPAPGRVVRDRR
jgi:glycosyltransferase involved in cell wall biosynthesis